MMPEQQDKALLSKLLLYGSLLVYVPALYIFCATLFNYGYYFKIRIDMHDIPFHSFSEECIRTMLPMFPLVLVALFTLLIICLFDKDKLEDKRRKSEIKKKNDLKLSYIFIAGVSFIVLLILLFITSEEMIAHTALFIQLPIGLSLFWYGCLEMLAVKYCYFNEKYSFVGRIMIRGVMSSILFFLPYGYCCAILDLENPFIKGNDLNHHAIVLKDSTRMHYLRVLSSGVLAIENPSKAIIFVPMEKIDHFRLAPIQRRRA